MTMFLSKPIGRVPEIFFTNLKKFNIRPNFTDRKKIKKGHIDINLSLKVRLKLDLISITLMSLISAA